MAMMAGTLALFGGCSLTSKTVTIMIPDWSPPSNEKEAEVAINARLKELNLSGIKIHIVWDSESGRRAKLAADTADKKVDILMTNSWQDFNYNQYAQSGAFLRLDDPKNNWLEKYGQGLFASMPGFLWDAWKLNGPDGYGIYGIPGYKDYAMWNNWDVNNTLLKEVGFDFDSFKFDYNVMYDPNFEAALEAAKKAYPNMYPLVIEPDTFIRHVCNSEWDLTGLGLLYFGYDPVNPSLPEEPATQFLYDVESVQKLIAKLEDFYAKGYIDPRLALKEETGDTRLGACNSANYLFASGTGGGDAIAATLSVERGVDVRNPYIQAHFASPMSLQGSGFGISIYSENHKEAVQFMNALYTDAKIATTLAYGVEGVHFTRNADGTLTRTEKGLSEYGAWDRGTGNYMGLVPALDTLGANFKEEFMAEQSMAVPTAYVGFVFNRAPIETEMAALSTVFAEYNYRISVGAGSPALMEEYRKKLYDNGMQKVIDEVNRQLVDLYNSKK
jgi:putative aldouronate transport system substrate-binding protein